MWWQLLNSSEEQKSLCFMQKCIQLIRDGDEMGLF